MILEFNKNIHRDIYPLLKSGEVVMMLENDHVLRQKGVKKQTTFLNNYQEK